MERPQLGGERAINEMELVLDSPILIFSLKLNFYTFVEGDYFDYISLNLIFIFHLDLIVSFPFHNVQFLYFL